MAACMIAVAGNLNYARGGYGTSLTNLRGGDRGTVSCTAHDAFGNQLECDRIPFQTTMSAPCLMYQYIVTVTHHNCCCWDECTREERGRDCMCRLNCHCATGGNAVTLNYYFSSAIRAEAEAQAIAFKDEMLLDHANSVHPIQTYTLAYVMTELPVTECQDSEHSTCLPTTELCPTLVAS